MKWMRNILRATAVLLLFVLCAWWGCRVSRIFYSAEIWQPELILDAGHGGEDGGAVSLSGQKESQINLDITLKLDQLMAFLGEPPLLLRNSDVSLHEESAVTLREKKVSDLKNRVKAAGQYPEATLVSIHQNSYPEEKYRGTQVFFAPTEGSEQLARTVQQAVISNLQMENNRQEKQIPETVYLMNHIKNRAILIECGFLTNPEEERMLQNEEYQRKLAVILGAALATAML